MIPSETTLPLKSDLRVIENIGRMKWMVAVDGSTTSDIAFEECIGLVKKDSDELFIIDVVILQNNLQIKIEQGTAVGKSLSTPACGVFFYDCCR